MLPGPDGRSGTVVVQREGTRQVLDAPYAASHVRPDGTLQGSPLSQQQVADSFGTTLAALPARPTVFLLYFLTGKDELTPESNSDLEKILADMRARPVPDIVVTGHTDTVGSADDNDALSQRRAQQILNLLASVGIDRSLMAAVGRGERELRVPTMDNVENPLNRRVEVLVR